MLCYHLRGEAHHTIWQEFEQINLIYTMKKLIHGVSFTGYLQTMNSKEKDETKSCFSTV